MEVWIWPVVTYVLAMLLLKFVDYREFKRAPYKGERYKALPLAYKMICPLVIVPLFIGSFFLPIATNNEGYGALVLLAFIIYVVLETQCIKWYEKNGL